VRNGAFVPVGGNEHASQHVVNADALLVVSLLQEAEAVLNHGIELPLLIGRPELLFRGSEPLCSGGGAASREKNEEAQDAKQKTLEGTSNEHENRSSRQFQKREF
jgi:hypothetical protein